MSGPSILSHNPSLAKRFIIAVVALLAGAGVGESSGPSRKAPRKGKKAKAKKRRRQTHVVYSESSTDCLAVPRGAASSACLSCSSLSSSSSTDDDRDIPLSARGAGTVVVTVAAPAVESSDLHTLS